MPKRKKETHLKDILEKANIGTVTAFCILLASIGFFVTSSNWMGISAVTIALINFAAFSFVERISNRDLNQRIDFLLSEVKKTQTAVAKVAEVTTEAKSIADKALLSSGFRELTKKGQSPRSS